MLPQVLIAMRAGHRQSAHSADQGLGLLSIITVPDLTFAANYVQSYYFIPFESFLVATLLYWMLCSGDRMAHPPQREMGRARAPQPCLRTSRR